VERWFAELTARKLRRSADGSVTELENDNPQMDQRVEQAPQAIHVD
jgi:hypothetical protein